jgi:hypothetical protein
MRTQAALAAREIKSILKKAYPQIKFSVTSQTYAGGDSVRVSYDNGVPTKNVEELISQYEQGTFDGMTDMYEYDNSRDDIPQTKYLFVGRNVSEENKEALKAKIMKDFGMTEWTNESCQETFHSWGDDVLWREMGDLTF